jgi:hypothetical protein
MAFPDKFASSVPERLKNRLRPVRAGGVRPERADLSREPPARAGGRGRPRRPGRLRRQDEATWHAYRFTLRREHSRPILDAIRGWLDAQQPEVLPKSPIGEAIGYALNHWGALIRPLEAGFLGIDNGASERALKPVAIGRKNWLFAGSDHWGQTAAVSMSLCTTSKDLGIDPLAYLRDVLDRVSTHPNSRIEELLPDCWKPAEFAERSGRIGDSQCPSGMPGSYGGVPATQQCALLLKSPDLPTGLAGPGYRLMHFDPSPHLGRGTSPH